MSLPYRNIRGPKKTIQEKLQRRGESAGRVANMATQQELDRVAEEARTQEAAARQAEIDKLRRRLADMEAAANAGRGQPPAGSRGKATE